jgi:hypothetical protein
MTDIYRRLGAKGFDQAFVQDFVLPDWWENSLAAVPANRALAEGYISRDLGFAIADLREPSSELSMSLVGSRRFKRYKNEVDDYALAAAQVAQRAAKLVSTQLRDLPPYKAGLDGRAVRKRILEKKPYVNLESLLDFCWDQGVIVFYLARIPKRSKPFSGMAMFCGKRPVIVLGSKRDSPAWTCFYLAHELAHILEGHVQPGLQPLADGGDLSGKSPELDEQENVADQVACEILTATRNPKPPLKRWNAEMLAHNARLIGPSHGVDPGVYALIYGKVNNRWPVAQNALKLVGKVTGACQLVSESLTKRLGDAELPEAAERFLDVLALPA